MIKKRLKTFVKNECEFFNIGATLSNGLYCYFFDDFIFIDKISFDGIENYTDDWYTIFPFKCMYPSKHDERDERGIL